jgi:hypothetical protein
MVFKVVMTLMMIVFCLWGIKWLWTTQIDPVATVTKMAKKPFEAPTWVATRDSKKIYQDGVAVADVTGEVRQTSEGLLFAELANAGQVKRNLPIEYQRHRLRIVKVGAIIGMKSVVTSQGSQIVTNVMEGVVCEVIK